jgi:phenylacetate-CoA ligase
MFVAPNGSKFWPTAGQRKLAEKWNVLQWQIIQHSLEDIEYKLVFDYDPTEAQLAEIRAWCNEQLGFEDAVRLTLLKDYIPTPAGKYEESICLIK